MHKLTGNRVFLLCSMAVLVAFATQISKIPNDAKMYPLWLLLASFITTIALFVAPQAQEESIKKEAALRILIFGLMIGLSLLLLTKIGYLLSTIAFVYAGLWYLRLKKNVLFWLFPLVLSFSMYFLFTRGLSVILPVGSWVNLTL